MDRPEEMNSYDDAASSHSADRRERPELLGIGKMDTVWYSMNLSFQEPFGDSIMVKVVEDEYRSRSKKIEFPSNPYRRLGIC